MPSLWDKIQDEVGGGDTLRLRREGAGQNEVNRLGCRFVGGKFSSGSESTWEVERRPCPNIRSNSTDWSVRRAVLDVVEGAIPSAFSWKMKTAFSLIFLLLETNSNSTAGGFP